jgi:hypothetical protein
MRATIVGEARNLSISCENGDKRLLGDVYVEGRAFICEVFRDKRPTEQFPQTAEGFISIFAQGSEALRRTLVVRNLDNRYQSVIDRYKDLRNLTTVDIDGAKLFISVMLGAADFHYFMDFIERNFFMDLQYVMDLPFHNFPESAEERASITTKYGYVLPTQREFQSGMPCFFPNDGISFGFEHLSLHRNGRALRKTI